jgi:hypothetical protein
MSEPLEPNASAKGEYLVGTKADDRKHNIGPDVLYVTKP